MTIPNIIPNAKIVSATSGGFTSNLWQIQYRDSENKICSVYAEQRLAADFADACREYVRQHNAQPQFDLLLTDYGTIASFAPAGEMSETQAQEILDYVG